jgi:hypothetical protein
MPQTKRKRRTKHRGNAAGTIEARGRTGRKPRPEELRASRTASTSSRPPRGTTPPTWTAAFAKACFGALMLFALVKFGLFGGEEKSTAAALAFAAIAALLYTPVMFATDRFIYQRKQKALTTPPKKKA